jgi:hypothetical protein
LHPPIEVNCDPEAFHPDPMDLAEDIGFSLGRDGENARCPYRYTDPRALRFLKGRHDGKLARGIDDARQLGEVAAFLTSGISEPPMGMSVAEKVAYRQGFAIGMARFEREREEEAYAATLDEERLAHHFRIELTDADIWPLGAYT